MASVWNRMEESEKTHKSTKGFLQAHRLMKGKGLVN